MKTKNLVLALIASIFTIGSLMAKEPVMAPKEISSSVAELINEEISYPEFAINDKFQGDVVIKVVIEEDGTLDVTDANSYNNNMINHVVREVENLDTNNFEEFAGQAVLVKLTFDLKLY